MLIFRKIEEQHCADPRQTNRSEVFSQDTLTRTLQREEGKLWKIANDPYHERQIRQTNLPNHYNRTPPQMEPIQQFASPANRSEDRFSRSSGSGEEYRNFHERPQNGYQQMSPRHDQPGPKRFRR